MLLLWVALVITTAFFHYRGVTLMRTRMLLAALAASVVCVSLAHAADVAPAPRSTTVYAPAIAAAPNYWSGPYVGLIGGYAGGDAKGGFGGLQAGYDWQFGSIVAGVRTDLALASIKHTESASALGVTVSETGKAKWIGSTVAKLGYSPASAPNWLVYGVAGVGYTNVNYDLRVRGLINGSDSGSDSKLGPTVGAGIAYAFSRNMNVSAEYAYTRFGGDSQHYVVGPFGGTVKHGSTDSHVGKLSLNYRF